MTEHEREMLTKLCARITDEKNPAVFEDLLIELNALLEKVNNCRGEGTEFQGENTQIDGTSQR
jgi:hypothetical protein